MSGTNQGGTASSQDRARQPKRAGGNSPEHGIEAHGAKRATRIGIEAEGGAGKDTGKNSTWGAQRECGGNTSKAPIEKHDQPKLKGKKFVAGKMVGDAPVVGSYIQRSERRHGAGNADFEGHEDRSKGSKTVPASRRF
jgi:hypothetical protein